MIELRYLQDTRSDAHPPVLQYRFVRVQSHGFTIDGQYIGKIAGFVTDGNDIVWSEWMAVPTVYEPTEPSHERQDNA